MDLGARALKLRVKDTDGGTVTGLEAVRMTAAAFVILDLKLCPFDVQLDLFFEIPLCMV
jgi:hypothetical protein